MIALMIRASFSRQITYVCRVQRPNGHGPVIFEDFSWRNGSERGAALELSCLLGIAWHGDEHPGMLNPMNAVHPRRSAPVRRAIDEEWSCALPASSREEAETSLRHWFDADERLLPLLVECRYEVALLRVEAGASVACIHHQTLYHPSCAQHLGSVRIKQHPDWTTIADRLDAMRIRDQELANSPIAA